MQGEKREREEEVLEYSDTERTPGWLRAWIGSQFPITFEPFEQPDFIPLVQEWQGFGFAHPPHSEAQLWCEKAVAESIYWRSVVLPCATDVRILCCPIKLPGKKKQIVSQMALVVFAGRDAENKKHPAPIFAIEPDGWENNYYKLARNRARFKTE